ncbi:unnamed protein product [Lupinus luteus]|uniref:Uncharacterized protein n=1 Tax=Lupinus luteus TaxID=3873 RepID=A0AAV1XC30_LUPLU
MAIVFDESHGNDTKEERQGPVGDASKTLEERGVVIRFVIDRRPVPESSVDLAEYVKKFLAGLLSTTIIGISLLGRDYTGLSI